jgi:hypothetical protein
MLAIPQKAAGTRTLPAASLPRPQGEPQAAIKAASPLLPPDARVASYGLLVFPKQKIVAFEGKQQIGKIGPRDWDGPRSTEPGDNRGVFTGERRATRPHVPEVQTVPCCSLESLMLKETPCSGPATPPRVNISSARRACSRSGSATTSTAALILGLTLQICSSWAWTSSTDNTSRRRLSEACCVAEDWISLSIMAAGSPGVVRPVCRVLFAARRRANRFRFEPPSRPGPIQRSRRDR